MRTRILLLFSLILALLVGLACVPTETGNKSGRENYQEDLSKVRKEYDEVKNDAPAREISENDIKVMPKSHVNDRLAIVYDTLKDRRGNKPMVQGFTVQVYAGPSRNAANEAKEKVYKRFQNVNPELEYMQPNFKVKVGQFIDRLEAQKMYAQLREEFPMALIIPEKIYLK